VCYTMATLSRFTRRTTRLGARRASSQHNGGHVAEFALTPECFWRLFETTGSIWAYLLYRDLAAGEGRWMLPILN
jgi:hypothetical protein